MQDEELLRAVVDAAPMAVAVVGPDMTMRVWNRAAEELLGWSAAEVVGGRDPSVPDGLSDEVESILSAWIEDPAAARGGLARRVRPDGRTVHLTIERAAAVELADGAGIVLWASPASDAGTVLRQRNRLSRRLVAATRLEEVLAVLTDATTDLLGAAAAVVLRRCPSGEHLHGVHGLGTETEVAEQVQLDLGAGQPWEQALADQVLDGTMQLDDRQREATFAPMGPIGEGWVLAVCGTHVEHGATHLQDLFRTVADAAWQALRRVALVAELDGKIEILGATNRLASSVGLDLDEALAAVSRQAADALSCERAAVYLSDPSSGEVSLEHLHASDAAADDLVSEQDGAALAEAVVAGGQELLFQDVETCELADGPWHADRGGVAVMGLPLLVGARPVGALVLAHTDAHPRGFTSLCQQVGAAVARQAALAVEHARLYAMERETVQDLRDLDRLKADWMAGVTHDLRSPLTSLQGFVETMRHMDEEVTEDQRRDFLDAMSRQSEQLVGLVDDLLLSARVDARVAARRRDSLAVSGLVASTVEALRPEQQQHLEVRDDAGDARILADRTHLQRVLTNLLTNAWRHGGEQVVLSTATSGDTVTLVVEDDGPGIPAGERDRVFERFVHGEHEQSSGLGLYVARGIVEAHDGSIRVIDRPDGASGARFEVCLDLQLDEAGEVIDEHDGHDRRDVLD